MDPAFFTQLGEGLGMVFMAFGLATVMVALSGCLLLSFRPIREALLERLRDRRVRHADLTEIGAQLAVLRADTTAQMAALRGEVYALRTEIAQATRVLQAGADGMRAIGDAYER
jgi:hypothetical protein